EQSCKILDSLGYNLNTVREDVFDGRAVYVVSAEKGNDTIPQFWIDKERLYMHRIIYKKGKQMDVVFSDYEKMEGY
ncbi:MAG TPA: outer membrane lipoprotein-sorting protein, partial [Bacteroidia bacterium]|nr:outer membrane lipoprotein-sorting protein [Bacteroidia bacterium]